MDGHAQKEGGRNGSERIEGSRRPPPSNDAPGPVHPAPAHRPAVHARRCGGGGDHTPRAFSSAAAPPPLSCVLFPPYGVTIEGLGGAMGKAGAGGKRSGDAPHPPPPPQTPACDVSGSPLFWRGENPKHDAAPPFDLCPPQRAVEPRGGGAVLMRGEAPPRHLGRPLRPSGEGGRLAVACPPPGGHQEGRQLGPQARRVCWGEGGEGEGGAHVGGSTPTPLSHPQSRPHRDLGTRPNPGRPTAPAAVGGGLNARYSVYV